MLNSLGFLIPVEGMKSTLRRFPLSSICSVALFVLVIAQIHELFEVEGEMLGRLSLILTCGFFWFGVNKLFSESRSWDEVKKFASGIVVFAGMGFLLAVSPQWAMHLYFIIPALLLLIMVAPYTRGGDDTSFWFYNRKTWFGVAVGILASIIWGGGLSAALGSIDYLFGVDINGDVYGDIWAFSCLVFGPLYALSWVPEKFIFTKEECNDPPGLAFLLNWVLAPLVILYMLILYAYLAKILIIQELPKGQLAYMITGFGGVGVATYLLGWPLKEEGGPLLKLVYKAFFPALIIPVIMQFIAIGMRIDAYGITEQRYIVALSAVWFAGIAAAYTIKKFPLKFIPLSLAALLVVGSFGPWGGVSLSGTSQVNRLEGLLNQYNILVEGKIVETEDEVPFADRQNISSILDYLTRTDRGDLIKPWLPEPIEGDALQGRYDNAEYLTSLMGFKYVSRYESAQRNEDHFNFYNRDDFSMPIDVRGFDFVLNSGYVNFNGNKDWERVWDADVEAGRPKVTASVEGFDLIVAAEGYGQVKFDVLAFVRGELEKNEAESNREMSLSQESTYMRTRADFINLGGENKDGEIKINNVNIRLMIGLK